MANNAIKQTIEPVYFRYIDGLKP